MGPTGGVPAGERDDQVCISCSREDAGRAGFCRHSPGRDYHTPRQGESLDGEGAVLSDMDWTGRGGRGRHRSGAWGGASLSCDATEAGSCRAVPGAWQALTPCVLKQIAGTSLNLGWNSSHVLCVSGDFGDNFSLGLWAHSDHRGGVSTLVGDSQSPRGLELAQRLLIHFRLDRWRPDTSFQPREAQGTDRRGDF